MVVVAAVAISCCCCVSQEVYFSGGDADRLSSLRHKKRYAVPQSPLLQVDWWRLVLDEAQLVGGGLSSTAVMAGHITARHRWAVTGTPIGPGGGDKSSQRMTASDRGTQGGTGCHWWADSAAVQQPLVLPFCLTILAVGCFWPSESSVRYMVHHQPCVTIVICLRWS